MTLDTKVKKKLKEFFGAAFSFEIKGDPTVAIVDYMMYVKAIPEGICTKDDAMRYFVERVQWLLLRKNSTIRVAIVLVDGKPNPVKRMVEHTERYKNKDVYPSKGKKYFPANPLELIPIEWIRFAGNYKLLRRELYPELFNAFMFCHYFTPKPGQMLVLSGFPAQFGDNGEGGWEARTGMHTNSGYSHVIPWGPKQLPITPAMEKADPDLYNRVFCLENVLPCTEFPKGGLKRYEWTQAKNDISEADIRMFWFDHWFQNEHILYVLNDGDIFSIGALYAAERIVSVDDKGKYHFRNKHTACLRNTEGKPKKPKKGEPPKDEKTLQEEAEAEKKRPKEEYVSLNKLYKRMRTHEDMVVAGVQNPVASMVFLIIMSGTDFFDNHMKGLGALKVMWKVFFDNIETFTHLVQLGEGFIRDTRTRRTIVVDDDLFIQFVRYCYLEKYEKATLKKLKVEKLSMAQLKERTQTFAKGEPQPDKAYHLPETNMIRVWARQVEWNIDYWKNGPLGHSPDPFEMWHGIPYFPYWRDPNNKNKGVLIDIVAPRAKPVDEVYSQHLYRTRVLKKRPRQEDDAEIVQRQQRVVDACERQVAIVSK